MRRVLAVTAIGLMVLPALANAQVGATVSINQKIVRYARAQMGRQVGNGECWTLADQALRSAGAKRPGRNGYGSCVFGREISRKALQPGDIIQFENVQFKHNGPNGSSSSSSYPHHTAIVAGVHGTRITLLHQNVNGRRTVQTGVIDMRDFRGGTMRYFRPQPR